MRKATAKIVLWNLTRGQGHTWTLWSNFKNIIF
jgi:hypothetical protein